MMGGSVKNDGAILKPPFCDMNDLCHIRRGNVYILN